jgi:hypothetical protein
MLTVEDGAELHSTAIRRLVAAENWDEVKKLMPLGAYEIYHNKMNHTGGAGYGGGGTAGGACGVSGKKIPIRPVNWRNITR